MPTWLDPTRLLARWCCAPPPAPTGLDAGPGGGSDEVLVVWDPLPASAQVAHYRVYQEKVPGTWWLVAIVTDAALGALVAGKLGLVDAPDYYPWPRGGTPDPRTYAVSAVGRSGLEGPMSSPVSASPP